MSQNDDAAVLDRVYQSYVALKGWDRPFAYSSDDAEAYAAEFGRNDLTGLRFLEIGFGEGTLLGWARDRGAHVTGAEINADCVANARAQGIALIETDLPTAAETHAEAFDIIAGFDVFEHMTLPDIVANLAACARMLKPGGRIVLRFPNGQSPFGLAPQHGDVTHITALSAAKIAQILPGTGLVLHADRAAHRVKGRSLPRRVKRSIRYFFQGMIDRFVSFVYAAPITLAPVVVVELRRQDDVRP